MKNYKTLTALAAAAGLIATTGTASAATLFADSFDRADNTDLNAATTGKSGSLGALTWVEVKSAGEPQIVGSTLRIGENASAGGGGGWSTAYLDHNFTDALITTGGEFTVTVDLVGPVASGGGTRFTGFTVGNSLAGVSNWSSNNPTTTFTSDFFFGYDTTGTNEVKVFINGITQDYQQTIDLDATGATLSVRFSNISDFNAGSTVSYEAFINGGTAVKTGSFLWSGTNENYLNVYSNYTGNQGTLDNFAVTAVPEPSATLLGGLGLLALLRRRRA